MRALRRAAALLGAVLALVLATGGTAGANGAGAVVEGRHLQLVSSMADGAENLSPGSATTWTIGISADGVEDGTIRRTLVVDGALAAHVRVDVATCTGRPSATGCPGAHPLIEGRSPAAGSPIDLGVQDATGRHWLQVRILLVDGAPDSAQALAGTLRLRAQGAGDDVVVTPPGGGGSTDEDGSTDGVGSTDEGGSDAPARPSGTADTSNAADTAGTGESVSATTGQGSDEDGTARSDGSLGPLAATGMDLLPWLVLTAALILLGALLRRRAQHETHDEEN